MSEHRIRLRGGWTCRAAGSHETQTRRLDLPVCWTDGDPRRLILTRRFGRPPIDPEMQYIVLEMERVMGVLSLFLNGRPLAATSPETDHYEIKSPELVEKNVLVLEVERAETPPGPPRTCDEWGRIALVVRTVDLHAGPLASPEEST